MAFIRIGLIFTTIVTAVGTAFAQPVVNHFDCRMMSLQLAKAYAGKPALLDELAFLTASRRGKLDKLTPAQIEFLDQLKADLKASGLSVVDFIADSYQVAVASLESRIQEAERQFSVLAGEADEVNGQLVAGATRGELSGMTEGGWATVPGSRWNQGTLGGMSMRLKEIEKRRDAKKAELETLRSQLTELKSVTPEKAHEAFLSGYGLLALYSDVEADRELVARQKAAAEQKVLEAKATAERIEREAAERAKALEQEASDRANLSWAGEIIGVQKKMQKAAGRLSEEEQQDLIRLEGALESKPNGNVARYLDRSWNSIYELYTAANARLGRHDESTVAVAWYLMSDADRSRFDPNSPSFVAQLKDFEVTKMVERFTSPVGHAYQAKMHEFTAEQIAQMKAKPEAARNELRGLYYALRPHMKSHDDTVIEMTLRLGIPIDNARDFQATMHSYTINSPSSRALRAGRRTLVGAAGLLASVGALSSGSHALNQYAGVSEAPTFTTQWNYVEPYVSPVVDGASQAFDAVGQFLQENTPSMEEMGERFINDRRARP